MGEAGGEDSPWGRRRVRAAARLSRRSQAAQILSGMPLGAHSEFEEDEDGVAVFDASRAAAGFAPGARAAWGADAEEAGGAAAAAAAGSDDEFEF